MNLAIEYIKFIIFCIFILLIPGKAILDFLKIKMSSNEQVILGLNTGLVLITLLGIFLSLSRVVNLIYLIIPFSLVYLFLQRKNLLSIKKVKINFVLAAILFFVVVIQSIVSFTSGLDINGSLRLMGAHGQDSIYHIALINNLFENIPPNNPVYSGDKLNNYHYFNDFFISIVESFTKIPTLTLYFKVISPFLILLFSWTTFVLIKRLTNSNVISYFAILFVTLSSNLYYIAGLFYPGALITPSVYWVDEYTTRLVNLQLLTSYITVLTVLTLLLIIKNFGQVKYLLFLGLLVGSLIGFKAYGAVLILMGLGVLSLKELIQNRNWEYFKLLVTSTLAAAIFFLMVSKLSQPMFDFSALWFIKTMFESWDRINYPEWELKRQIFMEHNNFLRIWQLYAWGIVLFIVGNLGGRILGVLSLLQRGATRESEVKWILFIIGSLGILLPMLVIQKGVAWNSIQFIYYSVLAFSLLTVVAIPMVFKKHKYLSIGLALVAWITLIPGVYNISDAYLFPKSSSGVNKGIVDASTFLKSQQTGIIIVDPKYAATALISSLSEKNLFWADEVFLSIQLVDYKQRKAEVENFFDLTKEFNRIEYMKNNGIKYIFTQHSKEDTKLDLEFREIYQNESIDIYQSID